MFAYHKATAFLAMGLALAAMGVVAGLFARQYRRAIAVDVACTNSSTTTTTSGDGGVLNASCTPLGADECSVGALVTTPNDGDICLPARAPTGTACTNRCYIEGATTPACDGITGACTGDSTECLGYCNETTNLNLTIPFDTNWMGLTDVVVPEVPFVWNYYFDCYWNSVRLFLLDVCWTTRLEGDDYGNMVGCYNDCNDYLDPDFVASGMADACLQTDDFLIDPNMTDPVRYLNDPDHLPQFRLCTFKYRCAALNQTAIAENSKRSTDMREHDRDRDRTAIALELLATSARFSAA